MIPYAKRKDTSFNSKYDSKEYKLLKTKNAKKLQRLAHKALRLKVKAEMKREKIDGDENS
jgi:hypothetical protein